MFASIDELTSVHSLIGNECFLMGLESIGIAEKNPRKRCATSWVVNYFLDDATDVAMSFCIIESSKLRRRFVEASMGS